MFSEFPTLQKLIVESARNLNQKDGQTLYNIELIDDEEDIKILICNFIKENISYEPQASDFQKLFYEYDNLFNKHNYFDFDSDTDFTDYVVVIRAVGRKWVEMNLPDKIDLKYYYKLYFN